ncbi:MAG: tocopherol cyclase family protein [Rectinemataceae bacterium]|nr:tocopherol cyclase family protein [Rectinemataceae bacterium]
MDDRNGYMLKGKLARRGYDWWWHSLVGVSEKTGEKQPFFIEYYVINPALGGTKALLGQLPANKKKGIRPSYAMVKAGRWGSPDASGEKHMAQLHNFYPISQFSADPNSMNVKIGKHTATETRLVGSVRLSPEEALAHPEYMSDSGEMSWDLKAKKILPYSVGFGTSPFFRNINAFQMYWHAAGMLTEYEGRITFNGEEYRVEPETSAGYQDKNWGCDYTSPWVWLNCNNFKSRITGKRLTRTSLDVGGAQPVVFGVSLPRRLLVAFYHEGELHEFNFSKFWTGSTQRFDCPVTDEKVEWNIDAWTRKAKIEIRFSCPRSTMLNVNYENPDGDKRHNALWNGGFASGYVKLSRKTTSGWEEIDTFDGELGGCEYGEYDR